MEAACRAVRLDSHYRPRAAGRCCISLLPDAASNEANAVAFGPGIRTIYHGKDGNTC